jgi:uncharacterized protein YkwD
MLALAGAVCCFAVALAPAAAGAPTKSEKRLLGLIDSARRSHGLPALRDSPSLCRSARRHSRFMISHDFFGHLPTIRASRSFRRRGEALAGYSGSRIRPRKVLRLWLSSPTHRALVLSHRMRFAGVGARRGRLGRSRMTVWTLHVGGR